MPLPPPEAPSVGPIGAVAEAQCSATLQDSNARFGSEVDWNVHNPPKLGIDFGATSGPGGWHGGSRRPDAILRARAAMMVEDVAPGLLDAGALGDAERTGLIIEDAAAALRRALILVEVARAVRGGG